MLFLMDNSKKVIDEKMNPQFIGGQLLTPLTRYSDWGGAYGIDNGSFSRFPEEEFKTLLKRQVESKSRCLFVTCPDVVGNGRRTLEIWKHRNRWIDDSWPIALVLQNGIENFEIPWGELSAVFIGGENPWKESKACEDLVKTAKILKKFIHVGRVNTYDRWKRFQMMGADTCDGSGVARYDHMLENIIRRETNSPMGLFDPNSLD